MIISPTILISKIFIGLIIFLLQSLLLQYLDKSELINTRLLMGITFLFVSILCLPFEFPYTISIPSRIIMPKICSFLNITFYTNFKILHLIILIWTIGTIVHLVRLVMKYYRLSHFIKFCSKNLIKCSNHNKKYSYSILKLDLPEAPLVIGLFHPIIILPNFPFTSKELDFIIEHECLHISNKDLLIKYLYEFFVCFYWWNPFVYSFRRYMNQIIELHTDEVLTSFLTKEEKIEYIRSLINVNTLTNSIKKDPLSVSFASSNRNLLLQRSECIINKTKITNQSLIKKGLSICFFIFLYFVISSFVFEPYFINDVDQNNTFEISEENAYLVKKDSEYLLYINNQYIATITDLNSDPNLKKLKILTEEEIKEK